MRLVTLHVDATDAEASFYEPVWLGTTLAGFITSGGYGHCAGLSLAMAYVNESVIARGAPLEVSIVGDRRGCRILDVPAIDPDGIRLRS
jgi:dimethylglycine dehydrogenase